MKTNGTAKSAPPLVASAGALLSKIVSGDVVYGLLLDGDAMGAVTTGCGVVSTMNCGSTPKALVGFRVGRSDGTGSVGQYSTMTGAEVGTFVAAAMRRLCRW
jgi:hypothetical protein